MDATAHPAVLLGQWLKNARQAKGIVKRTFAEQIFLSPAEYSEVEAGVGKWIGVPQFRAIVCVLELEPQEESELEKMLHAVRDSRELAFSNVFTREELAPIRYRHEDESHQPTELEREVLLNAVFASLV